MNHSSSRSLGLSQEDWAEIISAFRPTDYTGELLLALARCKNSFDTAPAERRTGQANSLFMMATNLLAECVGEDVLTELYGNDPPVEAPSEEHLRCLARRLSKLSTLFTTHDRSAKSSLEAAYDELQAIAGGDTPRLFAPAKGKQGLNNNKFRLAQHKLRALVWERFLQSIGNSPGDSQNAVASAFGCPWGTIYAWRGPVAEYLGQDRFDKAMRDAENGFSVEIGLVRSPEAALARMAEHGRAYRSENAKRLKVTD